MKIKVSELVDEDLDYWVAMANGVELKNLTGKLLHIEVWHGEYEVYSPSTNWAQGGPIIEREKIQIRGIDSPGHHLHNVWLAQYGRFRPTSESVQWIPHGKSYAKLNTGYYVGSTALIAAMRCFVASKFGEEVEGVSG